MLELPSFETATCAEGMSVRENTTDQDLVPECLDPLILHGCRTLSLSQVIQRLSLLSRSKPYRGRKGVESVP